MVQAGLWYRYRHYIHHVGHAMVLWEILFNVCIRNLAMPLLAFCLLQLIGSIFLEFFPLAANGQWVLTSFCASVCISVCSYVYPSWMMLALQLVKDFRCLLEIWRFRDGKYFSNDRDWSILQFLSKFPGYAWVCSDEPHYHHNSLRISNICLKC